MALIGCLVFVALLAIQGLEWSFYHAAPNAFPEIDLGALPRETRETTTPPGVLPPPEEIPTGPAVLDSMPKEPGLVPGVLTPPAAQPPGPGDAAAPPGFSGAPGAAVAAGGAVVTVVLAAVAVFSLLMIIAWWRIFGKAGRPGWAAIVPIYNTIVFLQAAGKPVWWFVLLLIPGVGFIFGLIALASLLHRFGKGAGMLIGFILLPIVFIPVLAFGSARYSGGAQLPDEG
jgi:hypothetical protein